MHTFDQNTSNVPAFLIKLWKLVEDSDCDDLISWSDKGNSFIIRDTALFARNLLPKYFKHNNLASFIRQLNMYGFKKLTNYEKCGMTLGNDEMEFHHPFFLKGSEELLEHIKRKISTTKGMESSSNANDILTDLTTIHEKQESMNNILIGMKKENELLWRELSSLRQKHKAQEQIIQKVIHFLVTIVQSSKQNIGVKRKIPHMLKDSPTSSSKRSRHIVDVVRGGGGKKSDFFFSVSDADDKATSPEGPVIQEVTELGHEDTFDKTISSSNDTIEKENTINPPQIELPLSNINVQVQSPLSNINSQIDSPLNNHVNNINSPDSDSLIFLDSPFTARSILSYDRTSEEEVLGLPLDLAIENTETMPNDIMSVITIPESVNKNNQEILNLISENSNSMAVDTLLPPVISIPEVSNEITQNAPTLSISKALSKNNNKIKATPVNATSVIENATSSKSVGKSTPVISIPDTNNVISIPESSLTNDGKIVIGSDVIPFSPSIMTLLFDNNAVVPKNNSMSNSFKNKQINTSTTAGKKAAPIVIKTEKTSHKVPTSQNSVSKKELISDFVENQENMTQNNLQLKLSDTNPSADGSFSKASFSNHILNVDQQLDWLHDELTNSSLNFDSNMLLGLFSSDDSINNAIQTSQLTSEVIEPVKDPENNITGNELVQYTPSLEFSDLFVDNFEDINFPDPLEENEKNMEAKILKTPPLIKLEKDSSQDCCFSENNSKLGSTTSVKGKKNNKNGKKNGHKRKKLT